MEHRLRPLAQRPRTGRVCNAVMPKAHADGTDDDGLLLRVAELERLQALGEAF